MKKEIEKYVQECRTCQQKRTLKKTGVKYEIKRSQEVWKKVNIDHITKLSKNNEKNSILVIKNQNNEMIHFKTVKEIEKVLEMWQNCWKCTWKLHELPTKIRTNREIIFINKW